MIAVVIRIFVIIQIFSLVAMVEVARANREELSVIIAQEMAKVRITMGNAA